MVDNVLKRLPQATRQGSIMPEMSAALERCCREVLLSDQVQQYDTLRQQTTAINAMLSQRYFTDRCPQYLWMPMETITAKLLAKDLRSDGTLLHQMLFSMRLRAALLRELDGVAGCWTGDTGGTHFFGDWTAGISCFPCGCGRKRARRCWPVRIHWGRT